MANKKDNRLNNIIKDLLSDDNKRILTAIKQLRKHGKREAIKPLIDLLNQPHSEEISIAVLNLLYDLKDPNVTEDIILAIENDRYNSIKPTLISIFWQSSLDASEYISPLINQAIHGDYMTGVEVMTVIENFDSTFEEDEINNLKYDIDDAISSEDAQKAELLLSLKSILENLNIEY